uniref:CHK kinase-like domain-containing protein n=1 Tax=Globisporangium ultimum (strain ATCC 200006 / CBS 805.95 / DAOM BR144) TaxID=431595 RepID=K3W7A3_GLOUD
MTATRATSSSTALAAVRSIPSRPDLLTNEFLHGILQPGMSSDSLFCVERFEWSPMEVGVISEVVSLKVFLRYDEGTKGNATQGVRHLVAKFLRPEFPFESMFLVESKFYAEFADFSSSGSAKLPFAVPAPVFTSNVLIVLERVDAVQTFTCIQGCPSDRISVLVKKLAQLHGRFWDHDGEGLAVPAGIGSGLTGEAKRSQFPDLWSAYLDDISLGIAEKERLTALCQRLSANPELLESVHDAVEGGPSTLIHGDYHVANILFPIAPSNSTVWLLDWATCGKGNPMRDLAFFFIVSVTEQDRREQESASLRLYHDVMATENLGVATPTLDEWRHHYQICVLNQFLILVVYDHLSKHLAANAKTEKLRSELDEHFRKVNVRACFSVLDNIDADALDSLVSANQKLQTK